MFHKNPEEFLEVVLVTLTKSYATVAYSLQFGVAKRQDVHANTLENNFWSTKLKVYSRKDGVFKAAVKMTDVEEEELEKFLRLCCFGIDKKLRIFIVEKSAGKIDVRKYHPFYYCELGRAAATIVASVDLLKRDNDKTACCIM
jgi:hypothetical protein